MDVFILGTCRIWSTSYINEWSNDESTVQSHYTDEIIQYIKWLSEKKELSNEEKKCFRNEMTDDLWIKLQDNFPR